MEDDNIHPVIRLLAARRDSHPEEFEMLMKDGWSVPQYADTHVWARELSTLNPYMTDAERALIYPNDKRLVFDKVMGTVMRKLLDGVN